MEDLKDISYFLKANRFHKEYGGSSSKKICIKEDNALFLIKMPYENVWDKNVLENSFIADYLGCRIFDSLGFVTQNCFIVTAKQNHDNDILLACEDFEQNGSKFIPFKDIEEKTAEMFSSMDVSLSLTNLFDTINKQNCINNDELMSFYCKMFVVDGFIGNYDRHIGNWGLLKTGSDYSTAPIFDCDISLGSRLNEENQANYIAAGECSSVYSHYLSNMSMTFN